MDLKNQILQIAENAKEDCPVLGGLNSRQKNRVLERMAQTLLKQSRTILKENKKDAEQAEKTGHPNAFLDRLRLTEETLKEMALGLQEVALLPDPVGEVSGLWTRPNGLQVGRMRIPLGVIGFIYESRPNVTVDAAGLCLKSGNAVILKGGREAINSTRAL